MGRKKEGTGCWGNKVPEWEGEEKYGVRDMLVVSNPFAIMRNWEVEAEAKKPWEQELDLMSAAGIQQDGRAGRSML